MPKKEDVKRYADAIITMIREDQDSGQVSRGASSWDELDESVDANDYYRKAGMPSGTDEADELRNAVYAEVGRRLSGSQGGPWRVSWTPPYVAALNIGRKIGYATREEAEEVGQKYLAQHGGAYHVHDG
jgi:hypothetical protein